MRYPVGDPVFFVSHCCCFSLRIGVCLVTFSYSGFYEPSVVNAVEGQDDMAPSVRTSSPVPRMDSQKEDTKY